MPLHQTFSYSHLNIRLLHAVMFNFQEQKSTLEFPKTCEENQDFSLAKTHAYGKYPLTQNRKKPSK